MNTNRLSPIHPGEFLKEALQAPGLSQAQFACAIGVPAMRVSFVDVTAAPFKIN